jgi:uncharacterized protein with FMN-binding domain
VSAVSGTRRIALWLVSTVAALVLLFSYKTSTMGAGGPATVAETPAADAAASGGAAQNGAQGGATTAPDAKTYDGSVAETRWGPVQVRITVSGGKIVDVAVPTYPTGNRRDKEINARALPILRKATLAAQGANIDTVSGATVTSEGYIESLQAALDAAHIS